MKDAGLDPALAVAVVPNAATAHLAVTQTARMRDGERVLVHGASEAWPSASPASHAS
jgi:NADPH:quinone reductase